MIGLEIDSQVLEETAYLLHARPTATRLFIAFLEADTTARTY